MISEFPETLQPERHPPEAPSGIGLGSHRFVDKPVTSALELNLE
jgi:hypothetical protein